MGTMAADRVASRAVIADEEHGITLRSVVRMVRLWILLAVTLVLWDGFVWAFNPSPFLLPSPQRVIGKFLDKPDLVVDAFVTTAYESVAGFAVAAIVGIALAVIIVSSPLLEELIYPYLNMIRITPVVAIAPLLAIWFGHGYTPKIVVAALIAFFPIAVTTVLGLKSADPDLINLMKTLNASTFDIFVKIRFPNALPYVFSAFRISAPLSVIGAIVGEMVAASRGLGYLLVISQSRVDTSTVFLMVVLSGVLGIAAFSLVVAAERRFVRWHPSVHLE